MSVTPTHSIVAYNSPSSRALQTAGNAAIGFFAAVGVAAIPILITWLTRGDFSRTAVTTLLSLIGTAILGVLLAYATKYIQARGSDTPPTVSADGTTPPVTPAPAVFAPPITPEGIHDILTIATMLQEWRRPVAPPAAIGHRVVTPTPFTGTGENVVLGASAPPADVMLGMADPPVKRSRAAKMPVVDTVADS